jgi:ABC-type Mn2+/Zn2+ transport system permease subunit
VEARTYPKQLALLSLVSAVILFIVLYPLEPLPTIVMASAALVFGLLGSLVAARRLYFLAGAAPHASLLAALTALPLAFGLGLPLSPTLAALGVLLVWLVGLIIYRGFDPDTATSLFVSLSASLSVILAYMIETRYALGFDLAALVFGDPLLATHSDAAAAAAVAAAVAVAVLATYREQVYIGVDREAARLTGLRVWLYDAVFFTILGLGVSVLIKAVGFVLEHVLVLVPGVIACYAPSSRDALLYAVSSSLLSAAAGLSLAIYLDISPVGATGVILFLLYLAAWLSSKEGVPS